MPCGTMFSAIKKEVLGKQLLKRRMFGAKVSVSRAHYCSICFSLIRSLLKHILNLRALLLHHYVLISVCLLKKPIFWHSLSSYLFFSTLLMNSTSLAQVSKDHLRVSISPLNFSIIWKAVLYLENSWKNRLSREHGFWATLIGLTPFANLTHTKGLIRGSLRQKALSSLHLPDTTCYSFLTVVSQW